MTLIADHKPITFAGFPLQAWAFVGRTWLALVLALYVSFWLELGSPASAGLTVAVLAFPSRGQGLEKAGFRVIATIIGVAAAIAISGAFSQTDWLLIAALALWVGGCVYVAGLFDGFRSYAAVLCIITVCLIGVEQLDTPQNVFNAGMERGAAIVIGILSVALINDVFFAPDYHPAIARRLQALHLKISSYASRTMGGQAMPASDFASLLREITVLRPEITSLATESSIGSRRGAAARTAMVNLVLHLTAARALAVLRASVPATPANRTQNGGDLVDSVSISGPERRLAARASAWLTAELRRRETDVVADLAALQQGSPVRQAWRAPFYRSHRIAVQNGLRAFIYFALAGLLLSVAGWPATSVSLAFVGILIGLSVMSPDQTAASLLALVAVPVGCLLAGLLEFFVLDGVTAYPVLAIGLFPFVAVPSLLMTSTNPGIFSFGRSNLVFTIAVFAPSNPQSYNPQSFLFASLFLCTAAFLLFVFQNLVPPLSGSGRIRILLAEARRDLSRLTSCRTQPTPEEAMFRDAVRVSQIVVANGHSQKTNPLIVDAIHYFDQATALRLAGAALERLPAGIPLGLRRLGKDAVANADGAAMLHVAQALASTPVQDPRSADPAGALAVAGILLARERDVGEAIR
jgi:uncharacterized membrane protein YccC